MVDVKPDETSERSGTPKSPAEHEADAVAARKTSTDQLVNAARDVLAKAADVDVDPIPLRQKQRINSGRLVIRYALANSEAGKVFTKKEVTAMRSLAARWTE
jgi:hypothetical protein